MADRVKEFWRGLLEYGSNEADKRRNWNTFCHLKFMDVVDFSVPNEQVDDLWRRLGVPDNFGEQKRLVSDIQERVDNYEFVEKHRLTHVGPREPRIDLSGEYFQDNISFAGRLLVGIDFRNAVFKGWADFRGAHFAGVTRFDGASFEGTVATEPASHGVASFAKCVFHNTVRFDEARFPHTVRFDDAGFNGAVCFGQARIGPCSGTGGGANFDGSKFRSSCDFSGAAFNVGAAFNEVEFGGEAKFTGTRFQSESSFNNAEFRNTTSFRGARFDRPPTFFETKIHEDVDFDEVLWSDAERSYRRRLRSRDTA